MYSGYARIQITALRDRAPGCRFKEVSNRWHEAWRSCHGAAQVHQQSYYAISVLEHTRSSDRGV